MNHRNIIRDDHDGFNKMVSAIDYMMFDNGQHQTEPNAPSPVACLACREKVYTANITSDVAVLLSDIMKTIFNITLNWCDKEDLNEVRFNPHSHVHVWCVL